MELSGTLHDPELNLSAPHTATAMRMSTQTQARLSLGSAPPHVAVSEWGHVVGRPAPPPDRDSTTHH